MTTVVTIDEYCKNPEGWKSKLPDNVIKYYDSICKSRSDLNNKGTDIGDIGKAIPESLLKMLEGMLSPQSLALLGAAYGVTVGVKMAFSAAVKALTSGLPESITTAMGEMVAEGASEAAVNASVLLENFMATMTVETFGEAAGSYALGALLQGAKMLGELMEWITIVMMVVQLIGMVFDSWDPCHLNDQLDAKAIDTFNGAYDKVFRLHVLPMVDSMKDAYGETFELYVWPIEYFADRGFLLQEKEDYYRPIRMKLMVRYLNSLEYNSDGQPIYWPKGGNLVNNNQLKGMANTLALVAADDNTVVANWLTKWWPLVVFAIMVLIIIIVFIIK